MEKFWIASTFLLLGLIIGAIVMIYYFNRKPSELEENEFDFDSPFDIVQAKDLGEILRDKIKDTPIPSQVLELKHYTNILNSKIDDSKENESWTKVSEYNDILNKLEENFYTRRDWFYQRIGKKVKPNILVCNCEDCTKNMEEGILLKDKKEAQVTFMHEVNTLINLKKLEYIDF